MKNNDFINANIGNSVFIIGNGDLGMSSELCTLIIHKTPLTLIKLTKGGMAYLMDKQGIYYSVPPRNVREFDETFEQHDDII